MLIRLQHSLLFALSTGIAVAPGSWAAQPPTGEYWVYFGTFTEFKMPSVNHVGKSNAKGIYVSRFKPSTGEISAPELAVETINPSYLAVHPNQRYVYSTMEDPLALGNLSDKNSSLRAYAINRATGHLGLLNTVPSNGGSSCYISIDKSGKFLMVANYTTGSVVAFRLKEDGSIGEQTSFMQHKGEASTGPHAHWIGTSPDNRFAAATDLGLNQVLVYRFDETKGTFTPNDPPYVSLPARSGPRHFMFAPNNKFGYALTEMAGTIIAFSFDSSTGVLKEIQTILSKTEEVRAPGGGSELAIHPSGRFLYAANRGSDTISVFNIDATKGTLTRVQREPTRGVMPRSFGIDPTGAYLIAGNEATDTGVVFRIDQETGMLSPSRAIVKVDTPVCVKFAAVDLPRR